ncbi:unnamed protein product [Clavelina lepadiformis]|uniref:Fibronectin type-III domain-containing protein n=1 Tax=Clavelina lepadiformis TaxID=159417 RepID=A0ABP0FXZ7_CLALP
MGKISPPSNLMRTSSRSKSFTLQWNNSEQDDAIYRIFVQKDFVAPPKMSSRASYVTSPFTATKTASGDDLQANTLYDVYLFAVNPTNSSDYAYTTLEGVVTGPPRPTDVQISNVESSSILSETQGKISPPSNLMRTSSRSKSFTLQWNNSEQDDAIYRIFVQKDFVAPPKMSSRASYVTSPFTATKTASGDDLQANTLYDVYLFAVNPTNSSDYAYTTLEGVVTGPPRPTDVQISNVESSSIQVTWQHSTSGTAQQTTNYEVTYAANGETMSTMQTNNAIVNHLIISGLSPNSFYLINVVALTDTDNIFSDESSSVSTTTAPSQLDPPTCSDVTSNSISLEWEDSTESVVTYTLNWSPSSEDGSNQKPGITTTSTTVYGLNTNTQYSFTLAVLNNAGIGMPSNEAVFVTSE